MISRSRADQLEQDEGRHGRRRAAAPRQEARRGSGQEARRGPVPLVALLAGGDGAAQLQRLAGNRALARLVQRSAVPLSLQRFTDRQLLQVCLAEHAITGLSDDELAEARADVRQLLPTLQPGSADHLTALDNQRSLDREHAHRARRAGFEAHARDVRGADDRPAHQREARELVEYARSQLDTYPDLYDRYLRQDTPDATEKVRVLGVAAAAAARMEFLLGSIYHQGRTAWEVDAAGTATSNRGAMVDDYTGGSSMEWCTRFATTALRRVRGSESLLASSGYKVANPDEFASVDLDYDAARGGAFLGTNRSRSATASNNPWAGLRETLESIEAGRTTDQTSEEAVAHFFENQVRPQPGDLLILRRGSASPNSFSSKFQTHTTMVESLSGTRISTVEGNTRPAGSSGRSDRAAGRVLDLTDPGDVEEIVFLSRPSLTSGVRAADEATIGSVPTPPGEAVTEVDLVDPIRHMNELLEGFARDQGWVNAASETGASVTELSAPAASPTP